MPGAGKAQPATRLPNAVKDAVSTPKGRADFRKAMYLERRTRTAEQQPDSLFRGPNSLTSVAKARALIGIEKAILAPLGSTLGRAVYDTRRALPGQKLKTFSSVLLGAAAAALSRKTIIGEYLGNSLRKRISYPNDPEMAYKMIHGNFVATKKDFEAIHKEIDQVKGVIKSVAKNVDTTVKGVEREFVRVKDEMVSSVQKVEDDTKKRFDRIAEWFKKLETDERRKNQITDYENEGKGRQGLAPKNNRKDPSNPDWVGDLVKYAQAGVTAAASAGLLAFLYKVKRAITKIGVRRAIRTVAGKYGWKKAALLVGRVIGMAVGVAATGGIVTFLLGMWSLKDLYDAGNEIIKEAEDDTKTSKEVKKSIETEKKPQLKGPMGIAPSIGLWAARKALGKKPNMPIGSGPSFGEREKARFLKFGALPEGFEFAPGHMGRLGNPAAVAARGAMPLYGMPSGSGLSYSGPSGPSGTTPSYSGPTSGPIQRDIPERASPSSSPQQPDVSKASLTPAGNVKDAFKDFSIGKVTPGAHKRQLQIPHIQDGKRVPAPIRYNNPGAAWQRQRDELFGLEGYGIIGGGNRIGKFPTRVHGLAANMDLFNLSKRYQGKSLAEAVRTWRGGNPGSSLVPEFTLSDGTKIGPRTVITKELTGNKEFMTKLFSTFARHESGVRGTLSEGDIERAWFMYKAGGIEGLMKQMDSPTVSGPVKPHEPGSSVLPPSSSSIFQKSSATDLPRTKKEAAQVIAREKMQPGSAEPRSIVAAMRVFNFHERRDHTALTAYLRGGGQRINPATTAWCAAFVNASLAYAGIKPQRSWVATDYMNWGNVVKLKKAADLRPGDVLVQHRGRRPGQTGGHVGIATGKTTIKNGRLYVEMLGGNQAGGKVTKKWVAASQLAVRRAGEGDQPADGTIKAPVSKVEPPTIKDLQFKGLQTTQEGLPYDQITPFAGRLDVTKPDSIGSAFIQFNPEIQKFGIPKEKMPWERGASFQDQISRAQREMQEKTGEQFWKDAKVPDYSIVPQGGVPASATKITEKPKTESPTPYYLDGKPVSSPNDVWAASKEGREEMKKGGKWVEPKTPVEQVPQSAPATTPVPGVHMLPSTPVSPLPEKRIDPAIPRDMGVPDQLAPGKAAPIQEKEPEKKSPAPAYTPEQSGPSRGTPPPSKFNPETRPAEPGSGGYGSYGRCFV